MLREGPGEAWGSCVPLADRALADRASQAGGGEGECAHTVRGSGAFVPADWGMEVTWGKSVTGPRPLQSY